MDVRGLIMGPNFSGNCSSMKPNLTKTVVYKGNFANWFHNEKSTRVGGQQLMSQ